MLKRDELESNEEIQYLREYLRIESVHPNVNYEPCIEFLKKQAESMELPYSIFFPVDGANPVFVITWKGTDPKMTSVLLNSHMDVVPVFADLWNYPPFGAEMDVYGNIYARGAQDMKSVGMLHLAAVRALKLKGERFKRTIHICFMPDEEMGGRYGMREFVKSQGFKDLNVGFSLDESVPSSSDVYPVFYAERSTWRINFKFSGATGHGSLMLKNTAGEKLNYVVSRIMDKRKREEMRLNSDPGLLIGDVTSINLTRLSGGVQTNVIPPFLTASFDIRLSLTEPHDLFQKQIETWCEKAGDGIEIDYELKSPQSHVTAADDTNIFWMAFKSGADDLGIQVKPMVSPGGTDSRFIRELDIPAFGFSGIINTNNLIHAEDEYINANTFIESIEVFKVIITKLANATRCYCAYKKE